MNTLKPFIDQEMAVITDLEGRLTVHKARLAAFREAANAVSLPLAVKQVVEIANTNHPTVNTAIGSTAISLPWAKTIVDLVASGRSQFDYNYIFEVAQKNGFAGVKDSCRDRIRDYVKTGIMIGDSANGFRITAVGLERANATLTNEAVAEPTATASN